MIDIHLVENDDELLEIAPLKLADDSESLGSPISEDIALEKVVRIHDDGYDFLIAKLGKIAVGYAVGRGEGNSYRSDGIYVLPAHRNRGIGTELKRAQIDFANRKDYSEIWSNVAGTNEASKKVLQKLGFAFEPSSSGYVVRLKL